MDYSNNNNERRKFHQKPYATRLRNTIGILAFRVVFAVVLVGGFALAGGAIGVYLGILRNAPEIHFEAQIRPGIYNSVIIEARTGEVMAELSGDENRQFVPISQIPEHLQLAFIAIEDERFLTHNGIDPRGIVRALRNNLFEPERGTEGASTITQQLIKNMQGLVRNDFVSKLQEQYLAIQFERTLAEANGGSREIAKEIILESYLNMINLGRNWHGVQVAAWNYFGKDVSELTISESAVIAAITRNPSRYLPDRFPERNRQRQLLVLDSMLRLGFITEHEHRMAVLDPVHDRIQVDHITELVSGVVHSYFIDALLDQVRDDLMREFNITPQQANAWIFGGGLTIYATQDMRIQRIVDSVFMDEDAFPANVFSIDIEYTITARNEITDQVNNFFRRGSVPNLEAVEAWKEQAMTEMLSANDVVIGENYILMPQPQAAFTLMDHHNGHVLAITGGRGDKTANRTFDRATVATRSPGSQFKVLAAFLPGIDNGTLFAATHITDEPWTFDDGVTNWSPGNWWSGFRGPTSSRRAIYSSANIVSARAFYEVGAEVAFDYLTRLGFTTLEGTLSDGRTFRDVGASVPLGGLTRGVTQLELTAAYATIANAGEYNRPVFYTMVLNNEGRIMLENEIRPERVITEAAAYILTDMMRDTMTLGTGPRANFRNLNMPIAGKTGTSQNTEDLGFTGYTPYFTAGVWMGFDRPRELRVDGAHLHIWREIMERVHTELELDFRNFNRPATVVNGSICRVSGFAPSDFCRSAGTVVSDLFVIGTVPTIPCSPALHRHFGHDDEYGDDGYGENGETNVDIPNWFPGLPNLPGLPGFGTDDTDEAEDTEEPWWVLPSIPEIPTVPEPEPEEEPNNLPDVNDLLPPPPIDETEEDAYEDTPPDWF
ncbi:MAG: transglycosylase domain-containing protein [Turicibacter sp.]|nr:transglycosylase domain-containing protein [Turicibacter sp.]